METFRTERIAKERGRDQRFKGGNNLNIVVIEDVIFDGEKRVNKDQFRRFGSLLLVSFPPPLLSQPLLYCLLFSVQSSKLMGNKENRKGIRLERQELKSGTVKSGIKPSFT